MYFQTITTDNINSSRCDIPEINDDDDDPNINKLNYRKHSLALSHIISLILSRSSLQIYKTDYMCCYGWS